MLLILELHGEIESLSGGRYVLTEIGTSRNQKLKEQLQA